MNAFLNVLNQTAAFGVAALLNTLWYAAAVVALAWTGLHFSRRMNAATRYWLWTAVFGFLVVLPFLPALVTQLESVKSAVPAATAPLAAVPAAPVAVQHLAPVTITLDAVPGSNHWPLWLLLVWVIAAGWQFVRLLRGLALVRGLKARAQVAPADALPIRPRRRVQVLASEEITSPVAVGYLHLAVIIPSGLFPALEESERGDVLLHELAHLARYDDWMTLATRAVGALLILHPLAAIVMRQIEREREMACDDFVVAHTGSARSYARSLARLHDLHSKTGTRLLAPALLGRKVSLPDRIESLLRRGRGFSARPSLANLGLSVFLLALLLGAGGLIPGWIAIAQTSPDRKSACADLPKEFCANLPSEFEVASIKPNKPDSPGILRTGSRIFPGRFVAEAVTAKQLVAMAYNVTGKQVSGGPSWIETDRYDVQAKEDEADAAVLQKLPQGPRREQVGLRLQSLLADRFKLKVHHETKELPVYALVVAKNGPKLHEFRPNVAPPDGTSGPNGHAHPGVSTPGEHRGSSRILGHGWDMASLAMFLSRLLDRTVLDKTGLKGKYDARLYFAPFPTQTGIVNGRTDGNRSIDSAPPPGSSGPSIFTALQEQLGLKLERTKGPLEIIVIDHIERPSAN